MKHCIEEKEFHHGRNAGPVGRSVQNPGPSGQMPTLTTNNQATFRHEMDASNHDMVGVLAREMGSIFSPLITNIARTNQDNVEIYQKISSQIGRMADFFGAPQTS